MNAAALQTPQILDQSLTVDTDVSLLCVEPARHIAMAEALGRVLLTLCNSEKRIRLTSHASVSGNFCLVISGKLDDQEVICLREALPFVRVSICTDVALVVSPYGRDLLDQLARKAINVLACVQDAQGLSVIIHQRSLTSIELF